MSVVERLEQSKLKILAYFDLEEENLNRRYAANKWPVRYILHHLADAESVLHDRIRRVISAPGQVAWAFDQDRWAASLGYEDLPMSISKNIFDAVRDGVIEQARRHYETSGNVSFVHSESGLRTLKDEFDKVAWHGEHHISQIERALRSKRLPSF